MAICVSQPRLSVESEGKHLGLVRIYHSSCQKNLFSCNMNGPWDRGGGDGICFCRGGGPTARRLPVKQVTLFTSASLNHKQMFYLKSQSSCLLLLLFPASSCKGAKPHAGVCVCLCLCAFSIFGCCEQTHGEETTRLLTGSAASSCEGTNR